MNHLWFLSEGITRVINSPVPVISSPSTDTQQSDIEINLKNNLSCLHHHLLHTNNITYSQNCGPQLTSYILLPPSVKVPGQCPVVGLIKKTQEAPALLAPDPPWAGTSGCGHHAQTTNTSPKMGEPCTLLVTNLGSVSSAHACSPLQPHEGCAVTGCRGGQGHSCPTQASAPTLTSLRILKDSVKALLTVPTPFACSSSTSCLKCWQEERKKKNQG